MTEWLPAAMVTVVVLAPPEVAANLPVVEPVTERVTVVLVALVVGLPKVSSRVTVKALVADELAAPVKAGDVMASWVAVAPVIVSCCCPASRPEVTGGVAVRVGDPAMLSP